MFTKSQAIELANEYCWEVTSKNDRQKAISLRRGTAKIIWYYHGGSMKFFVENEEPDMRRNISDVTAMQYLLIVGLPYSLMKHSAHDIIARMENEKSTNRRYGVLAFVAFTLLLLIILGALVETAK